MGKIFEYSQLDGGDLMLFEVLASRAFDHLNCQHTREFDQNFQKSQMSRDSRKRRRNGNGETAFLFYKN